MSIGFDTAASRWAKLDGERATFIGRCETYAAYTIPKLCPPAGYNQNAYVLQHDYQSLGAQGVNHAANKLMLALYAPSRSFFRLDPDDKVMQNMASANIQQTELSEKLAIVEAAACKLLDQKALRPRLYEAAKHLLVTGNYLHVFDKDSIRVLGIKNYCVKRAGDGTVLEIVVRECVPFASLDMEAKSLIGASRAITDPDKEVHHYHWAKLQDDGRYVIMQYVDDVQLPDKYTSVYTKEKMPYIPMTWDLASGDDYGTGLVEDNAGDFAALSTLSEATVHAAILASEFRWVVNPTGSTKPEDFQNSRNGDALPGMKDDISLVSSGKASDLSVNIQITQQYIQRIGASFLLNSAVTRQAERVTAEEVRMTAEELETSWGGAYSRIAVDQQVPMAMWLLDQAKTPLGKDSGFTPTIITGLAALSRSGDRDNIVMFFQDLTVLNNIPQEARQRLKLSAIMQALASARGVASSTFVMTEDEFAQYQQQQMQMQAQAQIAAQQQGAQPQGDLTNG